jgi:site-specific recombinase XerC
MRSDTPQAISAVAPKVAAELGNWLRHLGDERRYSPKTLEAYRRDVGQFLNFLTGHLGGAATLKDLAALTPADVRAFLAARRGEGVGSRSLMRGLAGIRGFARYLEKNGKGKVGALTAVRTPKIGTTLPRPLPIAAARRLAEVDIAGDGHEPWIAARDAAVLTLLYGSGLRISEALGLKRGDVDGARDAITVMGKGRKQRMVPVLAQALTISRQIGRCLSAPRAGRCRRVWFSSRWRGCAARSACRRRRRRMRCGIPSPRIFWRAAAICAPSRSFSATRRCPRRRSTPKSTPSG